MLRKLNKILDVMRVPAEGDPLDAVHEVDHSTPADSIHADVLIAGGGLGGVAAALAAIRHGRTVCLLEETDWLGGQATSQGVSAMDEHKYIESFGGTRSYYKLCETIRDHYRELQPRGSDGQLLNPGRCWVSRIAFEPRVAVRAIDAMLGPYIESRALQLFMRTKTVAVATQGNRAVALRAVNLDDGKAREFTFEYLVDATELGDLLPLSGAEYVVGAETVAETGEPNAQPEQAHPHCVQSCTYTFAAERRPDSERHVSARPSYYEHYRDLQPYSLRILVHGGEIYGEESGHLQYAMFDTMDGTKGGLWFYRRLVDAEQFPGHHDTDITMFNWPGIDFRDTPLVDQEPEDLARALQMAKRVSLGFFHWLQTELPDASGETGFPYLKLRPDVMGSEDGVAKFPYIRECRRILARGRVIQQDIAIDFQEGVRARHFDDSVGVGWYPIDIHQAGEGAVGISTRTRPFQIPLGILIPKRLENLLAANKNIGTTHITNGCHRLHPVEWNVGEAAGILIGLALETGRPPSGIHSDKTMMRTLQRRLADDGVPLAWTVDVPVDSADFSAVQRLVMAGGYGGGDDVLTFGPADPIDAPARREWLDSFAGTPAADPCGATTVTRGEFARALSQASTI